MSPKHHMAAPCMLRPRGWSSGRLVTTSAPDLHPPFDADWSSVHSQTYNTGYTHWIMQKSGCLILSNMYNWNDLFSPFHVQTGVTDEKWEARRQDVMTVSANVNFVPYFNDIYHNNQTIKLKSVKCWLKCCKCIMQQHSANVSTIFFLILFYFY